MGVASCPYAKKQETKGARVVIAPRRHVACFEDSSEEELVDLGKLLRLVLAAIYRLRDDPAYNLFWESAPTENARNELEDYARITSSFRWTLHIRVPYKSPGVSLASGVAWADNLPEDAAKQIR